MMFTYDAENSVLIGTAGSLSIPPNDPSSVKMAMLLQGECTSVGPTQAAANFGFGKSRYYQLRDAFVKHGVNALINKKTGPQRNYRRTSEATKLVLRARFLDPNASAAVIASKLTQDHYPIAERSVERMITEYGLKKKLHLPFPAAPPKSIDSQRTKDTQRPEPADPRSLETHVRQLLCNKIMGNMVGIWLLIPEHLRLGTWDLLQRWTNCQTPDVEPRIALQLVHEAAFCLTGQRQKRTLSQQGFEVANGLPFVVSDKAVHHLLELHTVAQAQAVQIMLGKLRCALGHYNGNVLAIDPHRIPSYSKRQMVRRKKDPHAPATKQLQTFFLFDCDSKEPIGFSLGSSSRTVAQATPPLLEMAAQILGPSAHSLVLADTEHYVLDLLHHVRQHSPFSLLVPMPLRKSALQELTTIPAERFRRHWIGYATLQRAYQPVSSTTEPYWQTVQRLGEKPDAYAFNAFLCTHPQNSVDQSVQQYPKRWHCEEFFNANQALGWHRAGTHNLNIRYGQMTMALIAQAAISMLRQRLGQPIAGWDVQHLARGFFHGLEGDIRLRGDTILVTYYNAPNADLLARHYSNLPATLQHDNVDPRVPWLYNYKIDFRFL